MPVFLAQLGTTLAGITLSMAGQLVTERFVKRMIVNALELLVKKTATDVDDKILGDAKRAWNVE